jgi:hypothetical protein
MSLKLTSGKISHHNPTSNTVNNDQLKHFASGKKLDFSGSNLTHHRLIGAEQKLLSGLTTAVESSRNLSTAKRAVRQSPTVLTSKWNALRDALIDDTRGNLS